MKKIAIWIISTLLIVLLPILANDNKERLPYFGKRYIYDKNREIVFKYIDDANFLFQNIEKFCDCKRKSNKIKCLKYLDHNEERNSIFYEYSPINILTNKLNKNPRSIQNLQYNKDNTSFQNHKYILNKLGILYSLNLFGFNIYNYRACLYQFAPKNAAKHTYIDQNRDEETKQPDNIIILKENGNWEYLKNIDQCNLILLDIIKECRILSKQVTKISDKELSIDCEYISNCSQ
jgi:hypothetical protein